jgi:radical SAM protein with 4Fe4S-binding SPASM domain
MAVQGSIRQADADGAAAGPGVEIDPGRRFRPHIYWYLTFRCNLSCAHCWVGSSPRVDTSGDLTTAEAMGVVDQMVDLNVGTCALTGGEVLTRRDALDILEALTDRGVTVALETNGTRVSARLLEVARRLQAAHRLVISISLDGATEETHDRLRGAGAFRRTVRNLRRLSDAGVRYSLQCVLNRSNVDTIPALFALTGELAPGPVCLSFSLLNPLGRGEGLSRELGVGFGELERILELIDANRGSFAGNTAIKAPPAAIPPRYLGLAFKERTVGTLVSCQFPLLGVLPNGDVTICALSRDNEELCFGNVRSVRLKDIWQQTRMEWLRRRYLAADHLEGVCGDCIWKKGCRGACRAWALEAGGSFDAPYPLCAALAEAGEFPPSYRISNLAPRGAPAVVPSCASLCAGVAS